jgi:hypothetical protein
MKYGSLFLLILAVITCVCQSINPESTEVWEPEPKVVSFSGENHIPSDAIVLLSSESPKHWVSKNGDRADWVFEDGILTVKPGTGGIYTRKSFGSVQLHVEWRTPEEITGSGQGRGNSGIYLQSRYEVQVLDSYQNRTYSNGQAGSIYKQHIPLVNASKKPGAWQTFDIIFQAPVFSAGDKVSSGYITVLHNGILIQNHVEIFGTTEYIGQPKNKAHGNAPLMLQDHGNTVSYRNIWIREL